MENNNDIKILVLDEQSAIGHYFKECLKHKNIKVFTSTKAKNIVIDKTTKGSLFVVYIIYNESELFANYHILERLKIPLVLGPMDIQLFKTLSKVNNLNVMNMTATKTEYLSQIQELITTFSSSDKHSE